jgi:hypothetical protein
LGPAPVRFSGLRLSAWNLQFQAWLRRAPPAPSRRNARIELYFHPSLAPQTESLGPNPGDLATLLSPAVRQAIEAHGWTRTTYSVLRETR